MFEVPSLEEIPEDLRSRIKEVAEKSGFVPNIFLTLARRPAEWRAFFAYHDALMDKETPALSKGDRELIVVATSAENHCLYCVVAHGAIARIRTRNPRIADQVATDWRTAELDDRQRAIIEVAVRLAVEPWTVSDELLGSLRAHGITDARAHPRSDFCVGCQTGAISRENTRPIVTLRLPAFAHIPPLRTLVPR